mgnify:CR=1 FL=1
MMISPETYYKDNLEGKTPEQILTVIRSLKNEMGALKNDMEHPKYAPTMFPSEDVRIYGLRDYLDRAKIALVEAGGAYTPSEAELQAESFDNSIPYISKIEFIIGGLFQGYETKIFTMKDNEVLVNVEHFKYPQLPTIEEDPSEEPIDREAFLEDLREIYIGEWRTNYDPMRFGYAVCDGTQWRLTFEYSNGHKPVAFHGSNAYPYNFNRLADLLGIEHWRDEDGDEAEE